MTRQPLIQPLLLVLVFFGPALLAALAFYGPWDWVPRGGAAHGELIEPPLSLPPGAFATPSADEAPTDRARPRWSFIYARFAPCDEQCLAHLNRLNQVRLALAEDRDRVQLVFLFAHAKPLLPPDAGIIVARLDDAAGNPTLELLGEHRIRDGRVYIADPLGNLVMSYALDAEQKGMLEDLKRLLKLSKIG